MRRPGQSAASWAREVQRHNRRLARSPGLSWRVLVHDEARNVPLEEHSDRRRWRFDELVVDHWLHVEQLNTRVWYLQVGDHQMSIEVKRDGSVVLRHYELGDLLRLVQDQS
jgi:hypothetical protein